MMNLSINLADKSIVELQAMKNAIQAELNIKQPQETKIKYLKEDLYNAYSLVNELYILQNEASVGMLLGVKEDKMRKYIIKAAHVINLYKKDKSKSIFLRKGTEFRYVPYGNSMAWSYMCNGNPSYINNGIQIEALENLLTECKEV